MSDLMKVTIKNTPTYKFSQGIEKNEYENFKQLSNNSVNEENVSWNGEKETAKVRKRWTSEEDRELTRLVNEYGTRNWRFIASHLPGRLSKQCRERWFNQLDPKIKKESLSQEEWKVLCEGHSKLGNRWAEIIKMLPGRTANQIKNFWNTMMRRKNVEAKKKRKSSKIWSSNQLEFDKDSNESIIEFEKTNNKKKKTCETEIPQETQFKLQQPPILNNMTSVLPSMPIEYFPNMAGYYFSPYSIIPVPLHYGMVFDPTVLNMYTPYMFPPSNIYFNNFSNPNIIKQQTNIQPKVQLSPISSDISDNETSASSTDEDEND